MKIDRNTLLIGRVSGTNGNNAWLVPLQVHTVNGWSPVDPTEFYPDGDVFCPDARSGVADERIVAFRVRAGQEKHRWILHELVACYPLIDRRRQTYAELFTQWHAKPIPKDPPHTTSDTVRILCADSLVIGPIAVAHDSNGFALNSSNLHSVPAFTGRSSVVDLDNLGIWTIPSIQDADHFHLDCRSDIEVLKSALANAKTVLASAGDVPDVLATRKAINQAADQESFGSLTQTQQRRLRRAQKISEGWSATRQEAMLLAEALLELPTVATTIAQARQEASDAAYDEARAEYAKEHAVELERLEALRLEHETLKGKVDQTQRTFDELEEAALSRLSDIQANASSVVADSMVLRALAKLPSTPEPVRLETASRPTAFPYQAPADSAKVRDPDTVFAHVAQGSHSTRSALERIHAAVLSGLLPILVGSEARTALSTYARVAVADRWTDISVGHDFLQPVDLLGVRAETGNIDRIHGTLLLAANSNCDALGPGMVILDGFNRGASESYLVPWITDATQSITIPQHLRGPIDTTRFQRSPDLIIAATAIDGATTVPISPDLWGRSVVIHINQWHGRPLESIEQSGLPTFPDSSDAQRDDFIREVMSGSKPIADSYWQLDASVLSAATKFAEGLFPSARRTKYLEGVRISVAECSFLPAFVTSCADSELQAGTTALARWADKDDPKLSDRLLRQAKQLRRTLT